MIADLADLIEDAVYAATGAPTPLAEALADAAARGIDVHVLAPDLAARGLHSDLAAVDYAGLVELLAAHERAVH